MRCPSRRSILKIVVLIFALTLIGAASVFSAEIHDAAKEGNVERIKALIKTNREVVSSQDHNGNTPLHIAAYYGSRDGAALLITNGANVNARNTWGETPLHFASWTGRKEVAELLIAKGADVNARNNSGRTPLHDATYKNNAAVADFLKSHGGHE